MSPITAEKEFRGTAAEHAYLLALQVRYFFDPSVFPSYQFCGVGIGDLGERPETVVVKALLHHDEFGSSGDVQRSGKKTADGRHTRLVVLDGYITPRCLKKPFSSAT